tara:strand:+ start:33 stop:593 length:561 start_codon:yes stop_codon:yes gene_type:complete
MKKSLFILSITALLFSCSQTPKIEKIGDYNFETPDWWDKVDVTLNSNIDTEDEMRKFVSEKYGADVGTNETWKEALKAWAIYGQRSNGYPVYIGHCFKTGKEYKNAISVYEDLYYLADKQKEQDWYKCYLSYSIGEVYELLNNNKKAAIWYSYSSEHTFLNSEDSAIRYYAEQSQNRVSELIKKTP